MREEIVGTWGSGSQLTFTFCQAAETTKYSDDIDPTRPNSTQLDIDCGDLPYDVTQEISQISGMLQVYIATDAPDDLREVLRSQVRTGSMDKSAGHNYRPP